MRRSTYLSYLHTCLYEWLGVNSSNSYLAERKHPHPGRRRCVTRCPGPLGLRLLPLPVSPVRAAVSGRHVRDVSFWTPALGEAWSHRKCCSVPIGVYSSFTIVCSFMFDSNLLTIGFYVLFSISSSLLPLHTGFQRGVSARTAAQCRRLGRVLRRAGGPDRESVLALSFQFRDSGCL